MSGITIGSRVWFNEPVDVDTSGGTPDFTVTNDTNVTITVISLRKQIVLTNYGISTHNWWFISCASSRMGGVTYLSLTCKLLALNSGTIKECQVITLTIQQLVTIGSAPYNTTDK